LRYTSGSMRAAALAAWRGGGITASPTSGFHHANHAHGGGFCTFNGLVLAALAMLDAGAKRIAIIDCDYHYGDGTEDILQRLGLHDRVQHWTLGADYSGGERGALARLTAALDEAMKSSELVIYQAGADSHENDPLGGVFTTAGYRERERRVFGTAARVGVPLAWNLAGGYQEPLDKVLALHAITMEEALAAEARFAAPQARRTPGSSTGEGTSWEH
jgi:acetoin utilization deacetylase AcuC-like enzyme